MKKRIVLVLASVAVTLGLASFALCLQFSPPEVNPRLKASLSAGASVDTAPVPVAPASSYDLGAHQTLSRVILLIRENYVEPERVKPYDMFLAALDYIQKMIPEVMVDDTRAPEQIAVSVGSNEQTFELGELDQLWEVTMALRDIFRFLQSEITDSKQRRDVEYAAINGMLSTLDPHSVLLKPESFDEVKLSTKGEFGGLGIVISIRDGALTIISPISGTPASRAGLKAQDKIVKIGEESTINMSLEEAVHRLRGKPGTKVIVWVQRKNWSEPRRFSLTRAIIKIESVTSKLLDDGVGYLRIKSFQNNTFDDLRTHLDRLRRAHRGKELKGLVLDLRNNPGGLLDQAILVSDRFIERGPLVITVGEGNRKREVKPAHFTGTDTDYPVVALVNGGSASASEIVSGALKNHGRAVVIGQQTFGKGSVQVLYDFKDKSALKLTIAQYLTPGDVSIQSVGITPDVEIVPATIEKDSIHVFVDDGAPREKDLDKHLERHGAGAGRPGGESAVKIVHVLPVEPANKDGADQQEDPGNQDEFKYDFEIRLAHDMLARVTSVERSEILEQSAQLFAARAQEQEADVVARLRELGVNWGVGPQVADARADATLEATGEGNGGLTAGMSLTLKATVRNTGNAPLYRVRGITESDNPLLKNREFVFGRLLPGDSRVWQTVIKLPKDMSARADAVKLVLGDHHDHLKGEAATQIVSIDALPEPRFAYSYRIDDREKGNGDGVLQVGERVQMKVKVTNLGPGSSDEALVTLKNLAGKPVFLDHGRDKIEKLKVGQTKMAVLRFALRKPAETVKLRVGVWDSTLGASVSEEVVLPVHKARKAKPDKRVLRVKGQREVPVYAGASETSGVVAYATEGTQIRSDVSFAGGRWRRVTLPSGAFGFLRQADVAAGRGGRGTESPALRTPPGQAPPRVDIDLSSRVTNSDVLRLRGTLSDERSLRDVYIFVNDKKMHYRSLTGLPVGPRGVRAALDVALPLKLGSNTIAVVARENDDVIGRHVFGVYRGSPDAVAERVDVPEGKATK